MSILNAVYFDGGLSRKHAVSVIIGGGTLKVVGREVNASFDAKGVRRSLRVANTPRWLYLPGGGACVTADNDAVDCMTRTRIYERVLHRWESRPAYAAFAIALVVAAVWLLVDRGVPRAVDAIAMRIPVQTEAALGKQTLAALDQQFLQPSRLPAARHTALRERFDAMVRTARDATPYRLEFRASPMVGPNAFALPAGIIVMTDELVKLSNNDLEVLGVLAHELGHVHHRHTLRRLLQGSATALIIAGLTGDVASATSLAAAAPALLLQTKYSRDNEREADRYAIDMMRKANYNPGHLAAILHRMSAPDGARGKRMGLPPFLSSHPPTEEREALARAGVEPVARQDPVPGDDATPKADLVPEKPKARAFDASQREVVTLIEQRNIDGLEKLLGSQQQAFEADAGSGDTLLKTFNSFEFLPRNAENTLNEWVQNAPASYAAALSRARFNFYQGLAARGSAFSRDTPEENFRSMRIFFDKAKADLDRSLTLTAKPFLSHMTLMSMARTQGNRDEELARYQQAVKLAPQSIELRLAHMRNLEPRWGGSQQEMQVFINESRAQLSDPRAANRLAARLPAYRAWERHRERDFSGALPLYNQAAALAADADILCNRASVLDQLNRDIEAVADVEQALSKAPDHRDCMDQAVWLAARMSTADESIALMTRVIEANPNRADALRQRGWRYQQKNKQDLAFADYRAAARLGDAWAELMTGKYLWSGIGVKQDRDQALVWLRRAAEKGHPDAKLSLKQALEQLAQK